MANGFRVLRHNAGGVQRYSEYEIADDQTDIIYNGDLIKLASGKVDKAAATDGNAIVGSFVGCMYVDNTGAQIFSPKWPGSAAAPSSTNIKALINDDRNLTYKVSVSAGTAAVGATGALVVGTGDDRTGLSGASVDLTGSGEVVVKTVLDATTVEVTLVP